MPNSASDSIFSKMSGVNLNVFGIDTAATYTKSDSSTVSLFGWWRDENEFQIQGYTAAAYKGVKIFEIRLEDTGKEPDPDETFLIDGTTYTVFGIASNDGYYAAVWVK